MPALQRSEFFLALNQLATERGLDVNIIIDAVRNAILAAYRKENPDIVLEDYTVSLNPNTGEARIMKGETDVTPPGFGRIAAQTARQVISQKVHEEERAAVLADFKMRIGTVMNGMILRFAGPNIIVILGKTEALLPQTEQIPGEKYRPNQQLAFYISEIREGLRGQELVVSRTNNGLLEGLFRKEVPEVAQGSVVFKAIAREPGIRSKVAVAATASGIDPVGSCVGQKGVRVQAVIQEFNGMEKIDVIQYLEDPAAFIAQALAPAKDLEVTIDEKTRSATVLAPQEELSAAIGKDGQNVRLASILTGYEITITGKPGTAPTVVEGEAASDRAVETGTQPTGDQPAPAPSATTSQSSTDNTSGEEPAEAASVIVSEAKQSSEEQQPLTNNEEPTTNNTEEPMLEAVKEVEEELQKEESSPVIPSAVEESHEAATAETTSETPADMSSEASLPSVASVEDGAKDEIPATEELAPIASIEEQKTDEPTSTSSEEKPQATEA